MTTRFEQRLARGEPNEPGEWEEYLAAFHRRMPGLTAQILHGLKNRQGDSSYEVLAQALDSLPQKASILDVGCGNGFAYEAIHARFPDTSYTGADLAPDEIELARTVYRDANFINARAQELPFPDSRFDAVVSHLALMLMNGIEDVLAECARVLKPGGLFCAVVDNMSAMRGDLLALHRVAGASAAQSFPNLKALQIGNAAGAQTSAAFEMFARAGFDRGSFRSQDYAVAGRRSGEEVEHYFQALYVVGSLPQEHRPRLESALRAEFGRVAVEGSVGFEIPLRLLSARKPL